MILQKITEGYCHDAMFIYEKKIVNIEVDKITASPYQPRTTFDEEALKELCSSIARYGVIQPVSVRKSDGAMSWWRENGGCVRLKWQD